MSLGTDGVPFTMPVEPAGSYNNGNNNGWGMDGAWWIIVLFLFMWGNGGWGNGWGGNSGYTATAATQADIQRGFDTSSIISKLDGINTGICDSTFALNNSINGLGVNVMQGFHGVDNAICNLGYQTQQGFNATQVAMMQGQNAHQAQLAQCCCDQRAGLADLKYQMATDTCAVTNTVQNATRDVIDNQNANSRAILDALNQNYIRTLENENQSLKLSASQAQQNATIGAMISASEATILRRTGAECPAPAYVVQPPTPVNFPTNCCGQFAGWGGNGCGQGCSSCC